MVNCDPGPGRIVISCSSTTRPPALVQRGLADLSEKGDAASRLHRRTDLDLHAPARYYRTGSLRQMESRKLSAASGRE